jgi:hypothetical protein
LNEAEVICEREDAVVHAIALETADDEIDGHDKKEPTDGTSVFNPGLDLDVPRSTARGAYRRTDPGVDVPDDVKENEARTACLDRGLQVCRALC